MKYPNSPPGGTKLSNSTVIGKRVQFDAFRTNAVDPPPPGFRVSLVALFQRPILRLYLCPIITKRRSNIVRAVVIVMGGAI